MTTAQEEIFRGTTTCQTTRKVIIAGAGPSGLLAAILLLRRNEKPGATIRYHVTLVDPGPDFGNLDEEGLKRHRSWMISLSTHGLSSVQQVPGLYEDYIEKSGLHLSALSLGMGKWAFDVTFPEDLKENLNIDRNCICGALAHYLNEHFLESGNLTLHYNTKALFVDSEFRRLVVRSETPESRDEGSNLSGLIPLDYDLLLGCDGIRSVVRNAFITNHRDFQFTLRDAFSMMKSLHITRPSNVDEGRFFILFNCLPNMTSFTIPERGGQLNFACGYQLDKPCDAAMLSDDPKVVRQYLTKHFKAFDLDCDEVALEWVRQPWNTVQQVHCNFYHSTLLQALLLGDAAHATLPNLGQGMNQALVDAVVLNDLLDKYEEDLDEVLPAFSKERVKEGNALTDLSFHTYSLSRSMQLEIIMRQSIRRFLKRIFPFFVDIEPMVAIAQGMKLSEAYDRVSKQGYFHRSRRINDDIMRTHFERQSGMIKDEPRVSMVQLLQPFGCSLLASAMIAGVLAVCFFPWENINEYLA